MRRKMTKYDNNKSVTGNAFSPADNYHFDILLRVEGLHSARWIIMIGHPKFAKKKPKVLKTLKVLLRIFEFCEWCELEPFRACCVYPGLASIDYDR